MIGREHLRDALSATAGLLMDAEVDALAGAAYHTPGAGRRLQRNGYRASAWRTDLGVVPVEIPKLRRGTYSPSWLLGRQARADRLLVPLVAEAAERGLSAVRVTAVVRALGMVALAEARIAELVTAIEDEIAACRASARLVS